MPFLDSDLIRPLYDVHDGGPPRGYQCLVSCPCGQILVPKYDHVHGDCLRVTRTLRGMISHQRIVHGITQQPEFNYFGVEPTRV